MVDLSQTIQAKSDQLNADDLLGGKTLTIRITEVRGGDAEQPITIRFEGDNGKPYKPGKSMRRVLVHFWGPNGDDYVGRMLTLYRDQEVEFGNLKVGGIRISHMSHLDGNGSMALAVKRGAKKRYDVKPLRVEQPQEGPAASGGAPRMTPEQKVAAYVDAVGKIETLDALTEYQSHEQRRKFVAALQNSRPDLHDKIVAANSAAFARLSPPEPGDDDHIATGSDDDDGFDFPDDPTLSNAGAEQ